MASLRSGPKRVWLPAAALILGAGLWFLAARRAPEEGQSVLQPAPNAWVSARPGSLGSIERTPGAELELPSTARASAPSAQPTREVAPASTRCLSGRVLVPEGAPPDESAGVVLSALVNGQRLELRAPVDASNGFVLEVPLFVRHATLDLSARCLYLDRPLRVDLARVRGEIRLEALFGGSLLVRVVDRQGNVPEGAPGASFELPSRGRSATIDRHGRALFEGLAPGSVGHIDCQVPEQLSPSPTPGAHVRAGEQAEVEWLLLRGASVSGWVTDSAGSPLEGVLVHARTHGDPSRIRFLSLPESSDEAQGEGTDILGRFELKGLRPGQAQLSASHPHYEWAHLDLGRLGEGERRAGIEIVLDPGGSIVGTLTWPDGRPAEGITVHAYRRRSRPPAEVQAQPSSSEDPDAFDWTFEISPPESSPATCSVFSDREGAFEVRGLGAGRYDLSAQVYAESSVRAEQLDAADATTSFFRVRLEDVAPGDPPVTLILQPYP